MKKINMIFNIIIIFIILQFLGMVFINKSNAESGGEKDFFEEVFEGGKNFSSRGEENASNIIQQADKVFKVSDTIYDAVRLIGGAIFLGAITYTVISLNTKVNPGDKARMKSTLIVVFVLALLFIFAKQIVEFIQDLLLQLESTM